MAVSNALPHNFTFPGLTRHATQAAYVRAYMRFISAASGYVILVLSPIFALISGAPFNAVDRLSVKSAILSLSSFFIESGIKQVSGSTFTVVPPLQPEKK